MARRSAILSFLMAIMSLTYLRYFTLSKKLALVHGYKWLETPNALRFITRLVSHGCSFTLKRPGTDAGIVATSPLSTLRVRQATSATPFLKISRQIRKTAALLNWLSVIHMKHYSSKIFALKVRAPTGHTAPWSSTLRRARAVHNWIASLGVNCGQDHRQKGQG